MHCYVINLPRSTERLEKITNNLKEVGLEFTIITAISPMDLGELSVNYNSKKNLRYYHKPLTSGEICCILSHSKALREFVKSDNNHAIILEDDALTTTSAISKLLEINKSLRFFDLIKLSDGASKKKINVVIEELDGLQVGIPNKVPNSAMAYLVNKEGALKILNAYEEIYLPADVILQRWWKFGLKVGFCSPPVFYQNGMDSEINASSDRALVRKSRIKKLLNRLGFELKNKFHLRLLKIKH